jgi:hypothetical protein
MSAVHVINLGCRSRFIQNTEQQLDGGDLARLKTIPREWGIE